MIMKKGDKGPHVTILQGTFQKLEYRLKADGIFGDETEEVVKQFQAQSDLKIDGLVGEETATNIVRALLLGLNEVETV